MNAAHTEPVSPGQPLSGPPVRVAARDLTRRYGEGDAAVDALRGVSLAVTEGALVAVMGPSGSGKSTLMHLLAGLDRPTGGEVWIDDAQLGALGDTELTKLRRRHIGFVFQFFNLLPMLTAEENILLPLQLAGRKPERAWVDELIDRVGLGDRRAHRPSELSGGQQQRVAIARALVVQADRRLRRRADGQPRLDDQRRDPGAAPGLRLELRPDDRDGHARSRRAAAIADRIIFLADGRIVARPRPLERARRARRDGGGERPMIRVALKGLASRKLRAALTALAIVLGVAMVSGTYVLHRPDRQGGRRALHRRLHRRGRRHLGQDGRRDLGERRRHRAGRAARPRRGAARGRSRLGRDHRHRQARRPAAASRSRPATRRSASASTHARARAGSTRCG